MERLTSHFKYDGIDRAFAKNFDDLDFLQEVANKLGEKEDDDEELGIDSHILFEALNNGFYAITDKERKTIGFIQGGELYLKLCFQTKKIHTLGSNEDYYFDGYGKTWALTKEELEKNDK